METDMERIVACVCMRNNFYLPASEEYSAVEADISRIMGAFESVEDLPQSERIVCVKWMRELKDLIPVDGIFRVQVKSRRHNLRPHRLLPRVPV